MSLFSKQLYTPVQESLVADSYEIDDQGFDILGESFLADVVIECNDEVTRTISSLCITDLLVESGMGTVTEAAGESLKAAKDKVVATFKNAWAKISAWFKKIIHDMGIMFTSAKKFYDKYKNEIAEKRKTMPKVEIKKFRKYNDELITNLINVPQDASDAVGRVIGEHEKVAQNDKPALSQSEIVERVAERVSSLLGKADNNIKSVSAMKKAFVNSAYEDKENYVVDASDMDTLIDFMANSSKRINLINKAKADVDKFMQAAIRAAMGADDTVTLKINAQTYNAGVSVVNGIIPTAVALIKQSNNYAVSFFKQYLTRAKVKVDKKNKTINASESATISTFDEVYGII